MVKNLEKNMEQLLNPTKEKETTDSSKAESYLDSSQYFEYLCFKQETDAASITFKGVEIPLEKVGFLTYCLWRIESDIEHIESEVLAETTAYADFEEVEA
jgi:hypothetical protein